MEFDFKKLDEKMYGRMSDSQIMNALFQMYGYMKAFAQDEFGTRTQEQRKVMIDLLNYLEEIRDEQIAKEEAAR